MYLCRNENKIKGLRIYNGVHQKEKKEKREEEKNPFYHL